MSDNGGHSDDSQWSDGDGVLTECSYAEGFPVADDNYYDDSGGTSQESAANPFDPEGDDPLRNRDISEKQITGRIMKEFEK